GRRRWPGWLGAEGPRGVTLRPRGPGERALARQLLDSLPAVIRARERSEEGHEVVDLFLRQREGLDVDVEIGILQAGALVVVVDDVPQRLLRAVVEVRPRDEDVAQVGRLEGPDVGLLFRDQETAQRRHLGLDGRAIDVLRVTRADELLGLPREGHDLMPDD